YRKRSGRSSSCLPLSTPRGQPSDAIAERANTLVPEEGCSLGAARRPSVASLTLATQVRDGLVGAGRLGLAFRLLMAFRCRCACRVGATRCLRIGVTLVGVGLGELACGARIIARRATDGDGDIAAIARSLTIRLRALRGTLGFGGCARACTEGRSLDLYV